MDCSGEMQLCPEGQAMTRIEEMEARIENSQVSVPATSIGKWADRLRDWGDSSDLLNIVDEVLAAREEMPWLLKIVERMRPHLEYAAKNECWYDEINKVFTGPPENPYALPKKKPSPCNCRGCQARALLAELKEGK